MLAAQRGELEDDRAWIEAVRAKLDESAKQRDAAFAQLKAVK